ncbi:MAG: nucleotidyltransferase family protein [Vicinamibacterales bacterium]
MIPRIQISEAAIADFCRRWKVTEFARFGSVLREDFGPDSDVDVLVSFAPDVRYSLFDLVHMQDELRELFGRDVDLVTRRAVERSMNEWRRQAILGSLAHVALAS